MSPRGVFTELARQAGRLTRHPAQTGWLYPTTRRQATHVVRGETLSTLRTEDYEMVFRGSLKEISNHPSTILLREREAWQNPKGGWMRTYGFADGHSEVHRGDDADFTTWEAQHQMRPASGGPP